MNYNRTLRGKIFWWLMVFVVFFIVAYSVMMGLAAGCIGHVSRWAGLVNTLHVQLLALRNTQGDYMRIDVVKPSYFEMGTSSFLVQSDVLNGSIKQTLAEMKHENYELLFDSVIRVRIHRLEQCIALNKAMFDTIQSLSLKRGYKNWGYEGTMRTCVHVLENFPGVDKLTVLQLRRREKDFIIRCEAEYLDSVSAIIIRMKAGVKQDHRFSLKRITELKKLVECYEQNFKQMAAIDLRLGIRNASGMSFEVYQNFGEIESLMQDLADKTEGKQQALYRNIAIAFDVLMLLVVAFSIFFSLFLSRRITVPLMRLSQFIDNYTRGGFSESVTLDVGKSTNEVRLMKQNFEKMRDELSSYILHFKRKVDERTHEIELQKNIIMEQQTNLIDSINSAKLIQRSMLQEEKYVSQLVPDSFVLYLPKDIVSGDFYFADWKWCQPLGAELLYMLVGDATGHGVPGAFMSTLGLSLVKSTFEKDLCPREFIVSLNSQLFQNLHKRKSRTLLHNFESMDMALCAIDYKHRKLYFVGANRPCIVIRDGGLIELKRCVVAVGEMPSIELKIVVRELDLHPGDCIYIFSDGYASQFGDNESKKLNTKRLNDILRRVAHLEPSLQRHILETTLRQWQGNSQQTDDVVVMGLKFDPKGETTV